MERIIRQSKKLSWLLRHGADEAGITMDAAGWVSVDEVCRYARLSRTQLERVVAENNKRRLQVVGDRIRCCQGHSTEGTPVTQEALEATWARWTKPGPLVHGTSIRAAWSILEEGIHPMRRTHVHLAETATSRVGKRANVAVHLLVDPGRLDGVWRSPNGVILARSVPPEAIVDVEPVSQKARRALADLRSRLRGSTDHHGSS